MNIQRFMNAIADYINSHIVGGENTYITKCVASDMVLNRGHVISIYMKIPEDMSEEYANAGPAFYAEELLNEFPKHTPAAVAEIINARVTSFYPEFITMMVQQKMMMERRIDDCRPEDLILTAIPVSQVPEQNKGVFIDKEDAELGLMLSIKALSGESKQNSGQLYYTPLVKEGGRDVTEKDWETARLNSISMAKPHIVIIPVPELTNTPNPIAVCGRIEDLNKFYDYFYLIEDAELWKHVMDETGADSIRIIPDGAYAAKFVIDSGAVRKNELARSLSGMFLRDAVEKVNGIQRVYEINRQTMKIRKLEGDET